MKTVQKLMVPMLALTATLCALQSQAQAQSSAVTVVEYYAKTLDAYFITGRAAEQAVLDASNAFERTGMTFSAVAASSATTNQTRVCRFYVSQASPYVSSHFYGGQTSQSQTGDCEWLRANAPKTFTFEGYDFATEVTGANNACASGASPVYRGFRALATPADGKTSNHRYTTSLLRYDQAATQGYIGEGPQLCATATIDVPGAYIVSNPPIAEATLTMLSLADTAPNGSAREWYYQAILATAAENVPDANSRRQYRSVRREKVGTATHEWVISSNYDRRDDTYWNGTKWTGCVFGDQGTSTVRTTEGLSDTINCNNTGTSGSRRIDVDISGNLIKDVVATIRAFPGDTAYATWGPDPKSLSATVTFPSGSRLAYQTSTDTLNQIGYDSRASNQFAAFAPLVAAGGNGSDPSVACSAAGLTSTAATGFAEAINSYKGTPCTYTTAFTQTNGAGLVVSSGLPNEWWSPSTLSIGTIGTAASNVGTANVTAYYTTNQLIRFAFDGTANGVNYFSCKQRQSDGSVRNCVKIGSGTYKISTLGDARIMELTGEPDLGLTYNRVMIERGGKVYFGFRSKLAVSQSARLNLPAANAVLSLIGIPAITP